MTPTLKDTASPLSDTADGYELQFSSLYEPWFDQTFPCDAQGHVDLDRLDASARVNYLAARTLIGREYTIPSVAPVKQGLPSQGFEAARVGEAPRTFGSLDAALAYVAGSPIERPRPWVRIIEALRPYGDGFLIISGRNLAGTSPMAHWHHAERPPLTIEEQVLIKAWRGPVDRDVVPRAPPDGKVLQRP